MGSWMKDFASGREEVLPVFDRSADHERAVTMGKIADILYGRGEFDEALRIRGMKSYRSISVWGTCIPMR